MEAFQVRAITKFSNDIYCCKNRANFSDCRCLSEPFSFACRINSSPPLSPPMLILQRCQGVTVCTSSPFPLRFFPPPCVKKGEISLGSHSVVYYTTHAYTATESCAKLELEYFLGTESLFPRKKGAKGGQILFKR